MYTITLSPKAYADAEKLKRNEPKAFKKANKLIEELKLHPRTGSGHPEPLRGDPVDRWSRRITQKHRLVYRIFETEVHVEILTTYGHYDDK
ncbi:MAG: Txe/YoeB family addiction module toxin [Bacteroidaceae bacterium]|nr:Txe/YoeB family addiction module toxin [Bacteroidaceae bacterium]